MKTLNIFLAIFFALSSFTISAQTKKETVKVWGNCGMCKSTIEKAAKNAGATAASWDVDSKILAVSYASTKTSLKAIEEKIAAAGYDTKNVAADGKAYDNLHGCCKYERKEASTEVASCCKDNAKCTTDKCCNASMASADCCKPTEGTAGCCTEGKSCCAK